MTCAEFYDLHARRGRAVMKMSLVCNHKTKSIAPAYEVWVTRLKGVYLLCWDAPHPRDVSDRWDALTASQAAIYRVLRHVSCPDSVLLLRRLIRGVQDDMDALCAEMPPTFRRISAGATRTVLVGRSWHGRVERFRFSTIPSAVSQWRQLKHAHLERFGNRHGVR